MPPTRRVPHQPSATDPDFERRLNEAIAGLSNGEFPTQTAAARALDVCNPNSWLHCML